jgi:hypothetical protein
MVTMGKTAKIGPAGSLVLVEMGHAAGFRQHFFRKDPRQLVLADHHLHIHAKVIRIAQHLNHAAHRRPRRRRPTGDLHIHHQAFQIRRESTVPRPPRPAPDAAWRASTASRQLLPVGNHNGLRHPLVERNNRMSLRTIPAHNEKHPPP